MGGVERERSSRSDRRRPARGFAEDDSALSLSDTPDLDRDGDHDLDRYHDGPVIPNLK